MLHKEGYSGMREHTKHMVFHPFLVQEGIQYSLLVPLVVYLFYTISPAIRGHIGAVVLYTTIQTIPSLAIGLWVKYHYAKPAIDYLEQGTDDAALRKRAARSIALQPKAEAITAFIRWAFIPWLMPVLPMYMQGLVTTSIFLLLAVTLTMAAMSTMVFFSLAAEYSLQRFTVATGLRDVLNDEQANLKRMGLSTKLLLTILLTIVPPLGNFLGLIEISLFSGINLADIRFGFYIILAQALIFTFINAGLLIMRVTSSISRVSFMLKDMAKGQGDLTKRLKVQGLDEVGELAFWFNTFIDDLEDIVSHVKEASLELHRAIENVNAGSQDLSQSTQEQAASVEEISASIEELSGSVVHNAELITEGEDASHTITKQIEHNKQVFGVLMQAVSEISHDSKKIGDIVSTVNEVAFHTNLLALNASVEAARAGEHGKGFAVVAGEVRSLAQRSAQAAGEIRALIESTVNRIKTGDETMQKTSASLEEMMSRMEFFFSMMDVIGNASKEQIQNISNLNTSISQIDTSTQKNAATVEELAGVLESLREQAVSLAQDVGKFRVSLQG